MIPTTTKEFAAEIVRLSASSFTQAPLDNRVSVVFAALNRVQSAGLDAVGSALTSVSNSVGFSKAEVAVMDQITGEPSSLEAKLFVGGAERQVLHFKLVVPLATDSGSPLVIVNDTDPQLFDTFSKALHFVSQLVGYTMYHEVG